MSDTVALATMTGPMIGAAFKFLFDRASAVLDRRRANKDNAELDSLKTWDGIEEQASTEKLRSAMNALEVYHDNDLELRPDDVKLVGHLETVIDELQRIEGTSIDIDAVARAGVVVRVESDDVEGKVTGLEVGEITETGRADVSVHTRSVGPGGEATGLKIEGRLG